LPSELALFIGELEGEEEYEDRKSKCSPNSFNRVTKTRLKLHFPGSNCWARFGGVWILLFRYVFYADRILSGLLNSYYLHWFFS